VPRDLAGGGVAEKADQKRHNGDEQPRQRQTGCETEERVQAAGPVVDAVENQLGQPRDRDR
jgi:hypothetical protein